MGRAVGIGAGGHAQVVLEALQSGGRVQVDAFVDSDRALWGTNVSGVTVVGDDSKLPDLYKAGLRLAFMGVGGTGDNALRTRLFQMARGLGFEILTVFHPTACLSASARLGVGTVVLAGAIVNPRVRIGDNVIINTGAIVEHDCSIGDHVHVATGARVGGEVVLEDGVHVGIGASIRQSIRIGSGSVVGAGAVVVKDVPGGHVVVGVPARVLRPTGDGDAVRFDPSGRQIV